MMMKKEYAGEILGIHTIISENSKEENFQKFRKKVFKNQFLWNYENEPDSWMFGATVGFALIILSILGIWKAFEILTFWYLILSIAGLVALTYLYSIATYLLKLRKGKRLINDFFESEEMVYRHKLKTDLERLDLKKDQLTELKNKIKNRINEFLKEIETNTNFVTQVIEKLKEGVGEYVRDKNKKRIIQRNLDTQILRDMISRHKMELPKIQKKIAEIELEEVNLQTLTVGIRNRLEDVTRYENLSSEVDEILKYSLEEKESEIASLVRGKDQMFNRIAANKRLNEIAAKKKSEQKETLDKLELNDLDELADEKFIEEIIDQTENFILQTQKRLEEFETN